MKEREKKRERKREGERERERKRGNYAKTCAVTRTVRVKTLISVIPR